MSELGQQHTAPSHRHVGEPAPWWSRGLVGGGLVAALVALVWVSALEVVDSVPGSTRLAGASVEVPAAPTVPSASASARGEVSSRDAVRTAPPAVAPGETVPADKLATLVRQRQAALSQIGAQAEQRTTELEEQRRAEALARKAAAEAAAQAAAQARRAAEILAARAVPGTTAATGATTGAWVAPTSDYRITAEFGDSGDLWSRDHTGLDFAAPTGTPVVAVDAGTVTAAGSAGAYGNRVVLVHADGTETSYAHLSSIDVEVGAEVAQGTMLGGVGSTGNSTGPHLHFEVVPAGGDPVDPMTALLEHGVEV